MFVDVTTDDSYTPQKISLRAGSHIADLQEIRVIDLDQPRGWQHFKLGNAIDTEDIESIDYDDPDAFAIRAQLVQIVIVSNHLNGKDTHIRHLKIYAPREPVSNVLTDDNLPPFTSPVFTQHRTIR